MPFKQQHRGRHPDDARLFSPEWTPVLREAVADLSFLLTRGYADKSALKLVGDRYQLALRQRHAISRCACADAAVMYRAAHACPVEAIVDRAIAVDGYNLLITTESMLSKGVLLRGRDGCIRDMASLHGSYRKVEETIPAIELLGEVLATMHAGPVRWYFDAPISNSGRLRALLYEIAEQAGWDWRVDLPNNPDAILAESPDIVATSDSWILDRANAWVNLSDPLVRAAGAEGCVIDLGVGQDGAQRV